MNNNFSPLFNPKSIAIIGASADFGRPGGQTLQALTERKYQGDIYPINPKYKELVGLPCYASVKDLPKPCDVAVIALPAAQVPQVVADCGQQGIRFAVVLGGGFRENGEEGLNLERAMLKSARDYHVRLIGPNCLGLVNVQQQAFVGFGSITKAPFLKPGAVSAVIQSGGFGNSLVIRCAAAGIGFRYVVASGNEADISTPELINAFVDDPETKVILAYIEGLSHGREFLKAARRALIAGKPLVIWKAGNTQQGMRAAASHTANMAGSYDIFKAAFREVGVIEVGDMEEAADYVKAVLSQPPGLGFNAAIMGGSGGSAVVFADAADACGIHIAPLQTETLATLKENLPSVASLDNPIDYAAGFISEKNQQRFESSVDAVLSDSGIHHLGLLFATVTGKTGKIGALSLAAASKKHKKTVLVFSSVEYEDAPEMFQILEEAQIPVLRSVSRVAKTMRMLTDYAVARNKALTNPPLEMPDFKLDQQFANGTLNENASKLLLQQFSIPVTDDKIFEFSPLTLDQVEGLHYPVALKLLSSEILHKSDIGGVRLHIKDPNALIKASLEMINLMTKASLNQKCGGFLVSPMSSPGLETIVGVINDPVFGPVVALGLGGIHTEILKDMTYRLAPFNEDSGLAMIKELRSAKIFEPFRGQSARDIQALAKLLASVSRLAWSLRDHLKELDINPVIVGAVGSGVIAVDALAILKSD